MFLSVYLRFVAFWKKKKKNTRKLVCTSMWGTDLHNIFLLNFLITVTTYFHLFWKSLIPFYFWEWYLIVWIQNLHPSELFEINTYYSVRKSIAQAFPKTERNIPNWGKNKVSIFIFMPIGALINCES